MFANKLSLFSLLIPPPSKASAIAIQLINLTADNVNFLATISFKVSKHLCQHDSEPLNRMFVGIGVCSHPN